MYVTAFWHLSPTHISSSAVCRGRDMFLAKTVAEIETQSDSTTAVGQSRGADGDHFCIPYGERNCYLRHKFNKYGMFAVPRSRRQNVFPGSPAQIPFCEKCSSSTTLPFLRQHLLSVFYFMLGWIWQKHAVAWWMKIFNSSCCWKPTGTLVLTWTKITGTRTTLKIFPSHCYTASHSLHLNSCDMMMINIWHEAD